MVQLAAAAAVVLGCLSGGPACAEAQYIVEQVVVSVSAAPDGSGDRVGSVHSGERVEVLEREEDHVHIRFGSGQEGWVKAAYLSSDPPLRQQLEERGQELEQLHKQNAALQSQLAQLQRAAASEARSPRHDPPAQDPELTHPDWWWLIATALLALACGFTLGWRLLDRRIRKRYGGLRIY